MAKKKSASHARVSKPLPNEGFWTSVLKSIWVGGVTLILLTVGKILWEETPAGRNVEHQIYGALHQWFLPKPDPKGRLPVTVIDISSLMEEVPPATPEYDDGSEPKRVAITPRQPLIDLIRAIAQEGPYAIGLDLNMAPDKERTKLSLKDKELLDLMHTLGATTRSEDQHRLIKFAVAVGERSQYLEPEEWLGDANYYDLAATASILVQDPRCLPWLLRKKADEEEGSDTELYSLSAQLALGGGAKALDDHGGHWFTYLHETAPAAPHNEGWVDECYWVDYSSVNRLRNEALLGHDPAVISHGRDKIANKVVLLGRIARHDEGSLPRVGVDGYDVTPGALTHACGVLTLLRGGLIQPTHHARVLADMLIAVLVILAVQTVRTVYRKDALTVNVHGSHRLFTWAAIVLSVAAGIVLAASFHILWTDPPLIALALLVHGPLEHWLMAIPRALRDVWRKCVLSENGGTHAH